MFLVSINVEDGEGILVVSVVEVVGLRYELAPIPGREETISDTIDDVIGEGDEEKVREGRKGVHVLMRDEKEERKKQANNKAKQHSTPKAVTFPCTATSKNLPTYLSWSLATAAASSFLLYVSVVLRWRWYSLRSVRTSVDEARNSFSILARSLSNTCRRDRERG